MKRVVMNLAASLLLTVPAAMAQMEPAKPAPELKKLDVFVGTWSLEGSMKPSPMGPGGPMTESQKCEWMDGGFYVVCHADYNSSLGKGVGLSVIGYSAGDKAYTYREFNSLGEFVDSKGALDGDTWTWTSDEKMGGMTMRGRFTIKITSASGYNFAFDMSQDGSKWTSMIDGKATKK